MRIDQGMPEFNPITITLETREDAETFRSLLDTIGSDNSGRVRAMSVVLSDWFTQVALF